VISETERDARGRDPRGDVSPADIANNHCTCLRLRRITRRLTQRYDERLSPSGLRITQFSLLALLHGDEPLSISALAEKMALDRTTLTRNLRPLIEQGLASLDEGPDARTRALRMTAKGHKAFMKAVPLWRRAQDETRQCLGDEGLAELHGSLSKSMLKLFGA
jgi:DNA-binding MarR family transcriptional regulator